MLRTLSIKNYALIDELTAEFANGLVILTGETGAGKSIIVDALSLILGDRASADVVRTGAEKAIVEGIFDVAGNKKLLAFLSEQELDTVDDLIARREVSIKGQSRCFINDSPVTLSLLKQVGEMLVDLHGQHDHQSLLRVDTHILMLDEFGGLGSMVAEYQGAFSALQEASRKLRELQEKETLLRERREFSAFQASEIDAIGPRLGEEEHLENELTILENAETLYSATAELYRTLYEGERSVHDLLVIVRNQLHALTAIDKQFASAASECDSAEAIVDELAKFVQRYNSQVEFSPERLDELRDRLGRLAFLKRKYGGSMETLLAHREAIAQELALAENFDAVAAGLKEEVETFRRQCGLLADRLSAKRQEVAKKIDRAIVGELAKLGIPNGRFTTRITREEVPLPKGTPPSDNHIKVGAKAVALNSRGYDVVEFFVSTNPGEEEKALGRVASGGEVSRIMLALKSILAKSDRLPVLIFDEIDVGVSGRVAQAVGSSLKTLSSFHQLIVITHLPQIAGFADIHFAVVKEVKNGRATTSLRKLDLEEQVREVAKLMSGAEVTEAGLAGARELMGLR